MTKKTLLTTLIVLGCLLGAGEMRGQSGTSLPYEENFDNYSSGATPSGWTALNGNAKVYKSSDYSHFSQFCLNITGNGTTNPRVVILPEFENQINTLQISCCQRSGSTGYGTLDIGYVTDKEDATSFVSLANYSSTGIYSEVEISMATAPANSYIAFRHNPVSSYHSWYIDDIVVETIPANPKPKNLVGTTLSNSRASLNWTNGGSETAWQVVYSTTASFDPNAFTPIDVNTNPATISGLSGSTTYYACVRAKIDANTYSRWSYKCSFTTKCDPESSFPFTEGFAYYSSTEVPECWDNSQGNINGANRWKLQNSNGANGSTKGYIQMYVTGASGTYYNYLISKMMNVPNENMKLSFYFKKTNSSKGRLDVYISVDGVISNTPIAENISVSSTAWELKEIDLPNEYKNTDNVSIVFKGTSDNSSTYICIDDVRMEIVYSCVKPTGLDVSSITSSSATFSWTDGGQGSWDVYYSTSSIEPDQETLPTVSGLDNNSCTLSLEPHKKYYAWVRGNCGDNDISSWSDGISFTTSTTLPYSYDFTDATELDAWTLYDCVSSTGIDGSGSNYYLKFVAGSPNPQHLITPLFENNSNAVLVSFDYKIASGTGPYPILSVGYSTSNNNSFTWPSATTFEVSSSGYQKFEYVFPTEGIKYIAIKYDRNGTYLLVNIDNISFTPIDKVHTVSDGWWDNLADWTPAGLPEEDDVVYINHPVTIRPCSPTVDPAVVDEIKLGPSGSLTIEDGGQLITNNAVQATVKKSISGYGGDNTVETGWNFIASPIVAEEGIAPSGDMLTNIWDLYQLNNTVWENYKPHEGNANTGFNLYNGRGYLYANSGDVTLEFTGAIKPFSTEDGANQVALSNGWNLVGNPYTHDVYSSKSYYKITTTNNVDAITVVENYDEAIAPCTGIVVKSTGADYVAFLTSASEWAAGNNGNVEVMLAQTVDIRGGVSTSSTTLDNAIVSFNEGSQLEKFYFGKQNANLYIPQGTEEYAIVNSEAQGEMPVNFKANENGQYTLTVNTENVEMNYLHLFDNMTGADIDLLLTPSYTFNAKTYDYESRFRLVFAANEGASTGSGTFAYIDANGYIIVNGGPSTPSTGSGTEGSGTLILQVIDVLGHQLLTKELQTSYFQLPTSSLPAGVYMLRLVNGNNTKTQKIVVR